MEPPTSLSRSFGCGASSASLNDLPPPATEPGIPSKNRAIITIAALKQACSFGGFARFTDADLYSAYQDLGTNSFSLFPKLPIELRNMIWRASFPRGRRIKVAFIGFLPKEKSSHPRTNPHAPVTFHVNRESRAESMRHYESLFDFNTAGIEPAPVYFRAAVDTLMISGLDVFDDSEGLFESLFPTTRLQNIRFLELHNAFWDTTMYQKALLTHGDDRSELEEYLKGAEEEGVFTLLGKTLLHPRSLVTPRFSNLKRLKFVVDAAEFEVFLEDRFDVDRCLEETRAWYEREKELNPSVEIPDIDVRYERAGLFPNFRGYWW